MSGMKLLERITVEPDDIKAALAYAAHQADHAILTALLKFIVIELRE